MTSSSSADRRRARPSRFANAAGRVPAASCLFCGRNRRYRQLCLRHGRPTQLLACNQLCVHTTKSSRIEIPLLICVQPEDESYMRTQLRDVRDGKVLAWNSFPTSASSRVHPARIMDKLNLLGAPIKRLVWIDADMYVRHNIDELCESCPKTSSLRRPSTQPVGVHRTCGQPVHPSAPPVRPRLQCKRGWQEIHIPAAR